MQYLKSSLTFIISIVCIELLIAGFFSATSIHLPVVFSWVISTIIFGLPTIITSFVSKTKKENIIVSVAISFIFYLFTTQAITQDLFYTLFRPITLLVILTPVIATILFGQHNKISTSHIKNDGAGNKKNSLNVTRINVTAIESQHRDDSSVSVETDVRHSTSYVGNDMVRIPYTVVNSKTNVRKIQDIWYQDKEGSESKLRLVNTELSVRQGHELSLFLTEGEYLDFIKNEMTGDIVSTESYLISGDDISASNLLDKTIYLSLFGAFPYLGSLMIILSTFTTYNYLNKPIKRPYLGRATIYAYLAASLASFLFSGVMVEKLMTGDLMGVITTGATSAITIGVLLSIGFSITSSKANEEKQKYYQYIKTTFK
ncbi:hypothetical protein [Vreelandella sp. EE27]